MFRASQESTFFFEYNGNKLLLRINHPTRFADVYGITDQISLVGTRRLRKGGRGECGGCQRRSKSRQDSDPTSRKESHLRAEGACAGRLRPGADWPAPRPPTRLRSPPCPLHVAQLPGPLSDPALTATAVRELWESWRAQDSEAERATSTERLRKPCPPRDLPARRISAVQGGSLQLPGKAVLWGPSYAWSRPVS